MDARDEMNNSTRVVQLDGKYIYYHLPGSEEYLLVYQGR